MFGKLYSLVKESINQEALKKANILASSHEVVVNEASGVIIDGLKSQIDKGRYNDLLAVFNVNHIENTTLLRSMSSKFAVRLNKYHGVNMDVARKMADEVIPVIMKKVVLAAKERTTKNENGMLAFFNKLSGYSINFETLLGKIPQAQLA